MIIPAGMYTPEVPKKLSQLENDNEFITLSDLPPAPFIPTKLSELEADMDYVNNNELTSRILSLPLPPDRLSDLHDDVGYATKEELANAISEIPEPVIPTTTEVSEGENLYYTEDRVRQVIESMGYKKTEMFKATTDALGIINITFEKEYSEKPHVSAMLSQSWSFDRLPVILDLTTTGCRIKVEQRTPVSLLGLELLLAVSTPVPNVEVSVNITPH